MYMRGYLCSEMFLWPSSVADKRMMLYGGIICKYAKMPVIVLVHLLVTASRFAGRANLRYAEKTRNSNYKQ